VESKDPQLALGEARPVALPRQRCAGAAGMLPPGMWLNGARVPTAMQLFGRNKILPSASNLVSV